MVERQVGGMKKRSTKLQARAMATIGAVPDEGMADSRQVNPDLVGAPRL